MQTLRKLQAYRETIAVMSKESDSLLAHYNNYFLGVPGVMETLASTEVWKFQRRWTKTL